MTVWESGRESGLLDDIIAGRKTIEGRLNKGKFADYRAGDIVKLRRDYRDDQGMLHDGEPDQVRVTITAIRQYVTFLDMVTSEGFTKVIPSAASPEAAADEYNKFYSANDQARYGVLAIEVQPVNLR
jgi:ASC-1-like (ASCH) protein